MSDIEAKIDDASPIEVEIVEGAAVEVAVNGNIAVEAEIVEGASVNATIVESTPIKCSIIGTEQRAIGIADDNLVEIDDAAAADDDYAKFTPNGLEGRSYAEVASDIQGSIDHDSLANFLADEHINWKSTSENLETTGTIEGSAISIDKASNPQHTFKESGTARTQIRYGTTANAMILFTVNAAGVLTERMRIKGEQDAGEISITGDLSCTNIGITDDDLVEIDHASVADDDYAKFTANGLEGRSYAEVKQDLDLEIGTDVLAEQAIGIADDNLLEVDDADAADDDYAKFTANGLEGRAYSEVRSDLIIDNFDDVRRYADFSTAISTIGATKTTLIIPNQQNVTTDETVPATLTLRFLNGGTLNISATKTVIINGDVEAGLYEIFEGARSVAFGSHSVGGIYPEWFGAVGDGPTDDAAAINAAIDSVPTTPAGGRGGDIILQIAEYGIGSIVTIDKNSIRFGGKMGGSHADRAGTTLKALSGFSGTLLKIDISEGEQGAAVHDLNINGESEASATNGLEIAANTHGRVVLDNISIQDVPTGILTGNNCGTQVWRDVWAVNGIATGLNITTDNLHIQAYGCKFGGTTRGLVIGPDSAVGADRCTSIQFFGTEFYTVGTAPTDVMLLQYARSVGFYGCWIEADSAITSNIDSMIVLGNTTGKAYYPNFKGCYVNGNSKADYAFHIKNADYVNAHGNLVVNVDTAKWKLTSGSHHSIEDVGNLGVGKIPSSRLDIDLSTEDLEIADAGSAAATEQDWIKVEVGGNTGYIRVFAAK